MSLDLTIGDFNTTIYDLNDSNIALEGASGVLALQGSAVNEYVKYLGKVYEAEINSKVDKV